MMCPNVKGHVCTDRCNSKKGLKFDLYFGHEGNNLIAFGAMFISQALTVLTEIIGSSLNHNSNDEHVPVGAISIHLNPTFF